MTFPLPRYNPRVLTTLVFPDTGDEGDEDDDEFVWFAAFTVQIDFAARWPITTTTLRSALSPLGLIHVRRS